MLYVGNEDTPKNKRNNRPYKTLNVWVYRDTPKAIHGENTR